VNERGKKAINLFHCSSPSLGYVKHLCYKMPLKLPPPKVSLWNGPLPAYFQGLAFVGVGILALASPRHARSVFGVKAPFSPTTDRTERAAADTVDLRLADVYLKSKAGRDLMLGTLLYVLGGQGNASAITTIMGLIPIAGFVDGYIVWRNGSSEERRGAWTYWGGSLVTFGIALIRLWDV
jgi:hypothetical protein